MKKLILPVLIAALVSGALSASAQTKIASVDMKKIFNSYYKTKMAQSALDKDKADLRKELQDMADALKKAQADYKQTLDQASDQAISTDEREKRKSSAQEKAKDVNSRQVAIEQYQRQAETQLADKSQRMISNLVKEIQEAATTKAKAGGYSLVVNSANSELVVFASPDNDISAAVIAQLNAGAPIDVVKPASGLPFNVSTNAP
jgi:outer membrane protein